MRLARILSVVLHPIFMPVAGVIILLTAGGWLAILSPAAKRYIFLITLITTVVIPLLVMPILKSRKLITDYQLTERSERRIPLLMVAFLYLVGAWILQKAQAPLIFALFLDASALVILACTVVNWKWKISTHMAGLGGLTAMVMVVGLKWMLGIEVLIGCLFLAAGLAGYARLRLHEHTPAQVYAGYLVGFGIIFAVMWVI